MFRWRIGNQDSLAKTEDALLRKHFTRLSAIPLQYLGERANISGPLLRIFSTVTSKDFFASQKSTGVSSLMVADVAMLFRKTKTRKGSPDLRVPHSFK